MATEYNIQKGELIAGDDHSLTFNVVDGAGAAQTMTGWALKFVLRRLDGVLVFSKTTGGGGITIGDGAGTNTRVTVDVDAADTLGWPLGWGYKYSLRRTDVGSVTRLTYGLAYMTETAE